MVSSGRPPPPDYTELERMLWRLRDKCGACGHWNELGAKFRDTGRVMSERENPAKVAASLKQLSEILSKKGKELSRGVKDDLNDINRHLTKLSESEYKKPVPGTVTVREVFVNPNEPKLLESPKSVQQNLMKATVLMERENEATTSEAVVNMKPNSEVQDLEAKLMLLKDQLTSHPGLTVLRKTVEKAQREVQSHPLVIELNQILVEIQKTLRTHPAMSEAVKVGERGRMNLHKNMITKRSEERLLELQKQLSTHPGTELMKKRIEDVERELRTHPLVLELQKLLEDLITNLEKKFDIPGLDEKIQEQKMQFQENPIAKDIQNKMQQMGKKEKNLEDVLVLHSGVEVIRKRLRDHPSVMEMNERVAEAQKALRDHPLVNELDKKKEEALKVLLENPETKVLFEKVDEARCKLEESPFVIRLISEVRDAELALEKHYRDVDRKGRLQKADGGGVVSMVSKWIRNAFRKELGIVGTEEQILLSGDDSNKSGASSSPSEIRKKIENLKKDLAENPTVKKLRQLEQDIKKTTKEESEKLENEIANELKKSKEDVQKILREVQAELKKYPSVDEIEMRKRKAELQLKEATKMLEKSPTAKDIKKKENSARHKLETLQKDIATKVDLHRREKELRRQLSDISRKIDALVSEKLKTIEEEGKKSLQQLKEEVEKNPEYKEILEKIKTLQQRLDSSHTKKIVAVQQNEKSEYKQQTEEAEKTLLEHPFTINWLSTLRKMEQKALESSDVVELRKNLSETQELLEEDPKSKELQVKVEKIRKDLFNHPLIQSLEEAIQGTESKLKQNVETKKLLETLNISVANMLREKAFPKSVNKDDELEELKKKVQEAERRFHHHPVIAQLQTNVLEARRNLKAHPVAREISETIEELEKQIKEQPFAQELKKELLKREKALLQYLIALDDGNMEQGETKVKELREKLNEVDKVLNGHPRILRLQTKLKDTLKKIEHHPSLIVFQMRVMEAEHNLEKHGLVQNLRKSIREAEDKIKGLKEWSDLRQRIREAEEAFVHTPAGVEAIKLLKTQERIRQNREMSALRKLASRQKLNADKKHQNNFETVKKDYSYDEIKNTIDEARKTVVLNPTVAELKKKLKEAEESLAEYPVKHELRTKLIEAQNLLEAHPAVKGMRKKAEKLLDEVAMEEGRKEWLREMKKKLDVTYCRLEKQRAVDELEGNIVDARRSLTDLGTMKQGEYQKMLRDFAKEEKKLHVAETALKVQELSANLGESLRGKLDVLIGKAEIPLLSHAGCRYLEKPLTSLCTALESGAPVRLIDEAIHEVEEAVQKFEDYD